MKRIPAIVLAILASLSNYAQTENPQIKWEYYSTEKGDLEFPNGGKQQTSCVVFDIDQDGIKDFVITERTQAPSVVWYKKNGAGWDRYVVDADPLRIEAGAAFYDVDNDGDPDLLFGGDSGSNEVWWWENPYPEYDPKIPWMRYNVKKSGANKHHDMMIADVDGDGLSELVFWNQGANSLFIARVPENPKGTNEWDFKPVYIYSDDSQMPFPGDVPAWKSVNEHEGLAKADIDMDGVLDIVGGGWWFKHTGDHKFRAGVVDASYTFTRSAAGQLVEGGRPEIILVVGDGLAPMFMYQWQNGTWIRKILIEEVDNGHSLDLIDFNGDGHLDIFNAEMRFGENHNPDAKCRILLGDGKGNFSDYIINEGYSHHETKIADLDGDGDYDIFSKPYGHRAPGIDIWLQNGTGEPLSVVEGTNFNRPAGLQLYSLRHELQKDVPATLDMVAKWGIRQLELSGYYGYEPKEFKKLLDQNKFKVPSMIFPWDRFISDIGGIASEARLFGAKYAGVGGMPHKTGNFTLEDARKNCEEMNRFAAECKKLGLTFFYHLHGFEFGDADGRPMIGFIMENTSQDVAYELDAMWVMYGGCDPVWLMKVYGDRVKLVHLKDMRRGVGPVHTGGAPDPSSVPLGQGQVDFPAVLRLAMKKGAEVFIIEDEAKEAIHQIPVSLEYLQRLK